MSRADCQSAAEAGDVRSQFNLACMHYFGKDGPVSYEAARVWFEKSAKAGSVNSHFNLAIMHKKGQGGPVSLEAARACYEKGAIAGDPQAMDSLGVMCVHGEGGPISYNRALHVWGCAAQRGHAVSKRRLDTLRTRCDEDSEEAVSQFTLGYMYDKGFGVKVSLEKALYWYRRAVAGGHKKAKHRLEKIEKFEVNA